VLLLELESRRELSAVLRANLKELARHMAGFWTPSGEGTWEIEGTDEDHRFEVVFDQEAGPVGSSRRRFTAFYVGDHFLWIEHDPGDEDAVPRLLWLEGGYVHQIALGLAGASEKIWKNGRGFGPSRDE